MEIWKPLYNFPNYEGSTDGRIRNFKTQRVLKTYENERGYIVVHLRKDNQQYTVKVSRVIAETFLGSYPGMDVGYRDLDKTNTRADNLIWCSRSETIQSAFDRGSKVPMHTTAVRVVETNDIFESVAECSRVLGCDKSEIFKCLRGFQDSAYGYHFERM